MTRKIFVTGSSGYIGHYLVEALLDLGFMVRGYDLVRQELLHPKFSFSLGDVTNEVELLEQLDDFMPEVIIDLAANTEVGPEKDIEDYQSNYTSPPIFERWVLRTADCPLRRIIFTSTQYVIGPRASQAQKLGYSPHTSYGQSKVLLELSVIKAIPTFASLGISYSIVRPTNVWGGKHPKYSRLFEPLLIKGLVAVPRSTVVKSYCHITSVIELLRYLTERVEGDDMSGGFNPEMAIIYATDEPVDQKKWLEAQVLALRANKLSGRYWEVSIGLLNSLSILLSLLTKLVGISNPLPKSRLEAMTTAYPVNLDRPSGFPAVRTLEDLSPDIMRDLEQRYRKN